MTEQNRRRAKASTITCSQSYYILYRSRCFDRTRQSRRSLVGCIQRRFYRQLWQRSSRSAILQSRDAALLWLWSALIVFQPRIAAIARVQITKAGGISLVVAAMEKYHQSAEVQELACRALFCLASDSDDDNVAVMLGAW
mmetsp:Transcript_9887/g.21348  ORF Transcript_9887/g.21348 Transcript_9887/m.21348 type:complete len:140 (-) Transcript_9887:448-867(-)